MRNTAGVRIVVAACAAAALAAVPSAATAADGCANAAFRPGAGASLPDCRAWEQVSPVDKAGTDVVNSSTIASLADGNGAYFNGAGALPGADAVLYDTGYAAARGAGWSTTALDPQLKPSNFYTKATLGISDDGTRAVVSTAKALTTDGTEGGSNLYLRDLTKPAEDPSAYRLIVTTGDQRLHRALTGFGGQGFYLAGNADLSAFAFLSPTPLVDGAPGGEYEYGLYLWHAGRLSLAGVDADGAPITYGFGESNTPPKLGHQLSDDGTRLWFRSPSPENALYQYVEGQGSTLITRSRRAGDDPDAPLPAPGTVRAARDGQTITFVGGAAMVDAPSGLYRWSAADDSLARVGPEDAGVRALDGVSPDGDTVWFESNRPLTADAGTDSENRLYQLDVSTGDVRLVAHFGPAETGGPAGLRLSPDGRRVAFMAFTPLTGVDNANPACVEPGLPGGDGLCGQIYAWDADQPDAPLQCVSCGAPGTTYTGTATFGRVSTSFDGRESRAVLDDGTVFFDTPERLAGGDTNRAVDVYQWRPGTGAQLLSGGTTAAPANFGDISANGRDVFFATAARLVPQDTDAIADLYTARVGGGIAAQQVAPAAAGEGCSGESCRPGNAAQPAPLAQGSATFLAPDPGPVPRFSLNKPSQRTLRTAARRGRLVLPVRVTAAGSLSATLRSRLGTRKYRTVGRATGRRSSAGTVRLTFRLTKAARRNLRRTGRMTTRLTIAYSERLKGYRTTLRFTTGRTGSDRGGAR